MRSTSPLCLFTGALADHAHHVTMLGTSGDYLDPGLTVGLTRSHHVTLHQALRVAGLGEHSSVPDRVLRAARLGHFLGRLALHYGDGVIVLPASVLKEIAGALMRVAADLETDR